MTDGPAPLPGLLSTAPAVRLSLPANQELGHTGQSIQLCDSLGLPPDGKAKVKPYPRPATVEDFAPIFSTLSDLLPFQIAIPLCVSYLPVTVGSRNAKQPGTRPGRRNQRVPAR